MNVPLRQSPLPATMLGIGESRGFKGHPYTLKTEKRLRDIVWEPLWQVLQNWPIRG